MIDERLSILLDKLLETSIEFLNENGYDEVDGLRFGVVGLQDAMKYGMNCPSIDNHIAIYNCDNDKIGEYL